VSDQSGQNGARPEFPPQEQHEPARPRLTTKTGAAILAGLLAILLVSGAVTVWASSSTPKAAMPAAWTAEPSAATTVAQQATAPAATGNRASSSTTASSTARTTSTATGKVTSASAHASTATTSSSLPSCSGGQTVTTSVFSLKVPEGWKCFEQTTSATGAIIGMYDDGLDVLQISVSPAKDVVSACGAYLAFQPNAIVLAQPDTVWGGKTAKTAKVTVSSFTAQARCAESKGTIYVMVGSPGYGTLDSVVAAMSAVSSAWLWK
jgi:hypothetical protein